MSYKLMLIAPDGDIVTDYESDTIEEACKASADMGSRWIFYPFHFVIKDQGRLSPRQRVIEPPDGFEFLKGKSITTAIRFISEHGMDILDRA